MEKKEIIQLKDKKDLAYDMKMTVFSSNSKVSDV